MLAIFKITQRGDEIQISYNLTKLKKLTGGNNYEFKKIYFSNSMRFIITYRNYRMSKERN
ncbi:hypothetical protein TCEA9_24270 [Thermobrachium celere]|nr:hypothetical protein TCEA9_24270 [Thermobrachium celere]